MEKIRTTVRVAARINSEIARASYDPEAHVQRVAAFVDRKLNELSAATRLPQAQLSVLAALNIADDMLKAHDEITRPAPRTDGDAAEARGGGQMNAALDCERRLSPRCRTARTRCISARGCSTPGAARTTLTKAASRRRSPIVMPAACAST